MLKNTHPLYRTLLGLTRSEKYTRAFLHHAATEGMSTLELDQFGIVAREFHACSLVVVDLEEGEDGTKVHK
jgi:hypothetical protein